MQAVLSTFKDRGFSVDLKVTTNWGTDELQLNISTVSSADVSTFTCMDKKEMFSEIFYVICNFRNIPYQKLQKSLKYTFIRPGESLLHLATVCSIMKALLSIESSLGICSHEKLRGN